MTTLVPSPSLEICDSPVPNTAGRASAEPEGAKIKKKRCWFLTPYLHWREEAPYWKRHCSSASYTCPGATVGYRKSRFRGSLSRHVPRPELSKKQTYNSIVSCNKGAFSPLCMISRVRLEKQRPPPPPGRLPPAALPASFRHQKKHTFDIDAFPSKRKTPQSTRLKRNDLLRLCHCVLLACTSLLKPQGKLAGKRAASRGSCVRARDYV